MSGGLESLVVLGGDALKKNWEHAFNAHRTKKLPKANLIKIPHHGASNAISVHPRQHELTYLDICLKNQATSGVIFAGHSRHPDQEVYGHLKSRLSLFCLSNGRKNKPSNPLKLNIPSAAATTPATTFCNSVLSFEIQSNGTIRTVVGNGCAAC